MKKKRSQKNSLDFKSKNHVFALMGLFLVLGFTLSFIGTSDSFGVTGYAVKKVNLDNFDGSFISNLFTNWEEGNIDTNISKYFIFFMLALLISGIMGSLNFLGKFTRISISIIIAFLATAFITPAEVLGIVTSYTALGLALTSILPFVVLILFSATNLTEGTTSVGKILIDRLLWALFGIFLVYRVIMLFLSDKTFSWVIAGIVIISLLIALYITFAHNKFYAWVKSLGRMIAKERSKDIKSSREDEIDIYKHHFP